MKRSVIPDGSSMGGDCLPIQAAAKISFTIKSLSGVFAIIL